MNRNTFLQGFIAGRHLIAGARSATVRVAGYEQQDFLNGLACGLTGSVEFSDPDPTGDTNCTLDYYLEEATRTLVVTETSDAGGMSYTWDAVNAELTATGLSDSSPV